MEIYDWVYILTQPFSTYTVYKFMQIFFDKRRVSGKTEFLSYMIYNMSIMFIYLYLGIPIVTLISSLIFFFLITLNYKSPLLKRILAVLLMYSSLMFIDIIGTNFLFGDMTLKFFSVNHYTSVIGLISIKVLSFIMVLVIGNFKNIKKGIRIPIIHWVSIILIPSVYLLLTILLLQIPKIPSYYIFPIIVLLFIANFITFYLYDSIMASFHLKVEQFQLIEQNKSYERQFAVMQQALENTSVIRHDFKQHLMAIRSYIRLNRIDECLTYLNDLLRFTESTNVYAKSGHPIIDSIINFKFEQASQKSIHVVVKLIIPTELPLLSTFDIATLLGNLLDNAIEATCKRKDNRSIRIFMEYKKGRLFIQFKNTFDGIVNKSNDKLITTKSDEKHHGIGIRRIQEVVKKYDGEIYMEHENELFSTDILLYLSEK